MSVEAQKYVPNPHAYLKLQALAAAAPHFGFQTADDLMVAVGYGRVSALASGPPPAAARNH